MVNACKLLLTVVMTNKLIQHGVWSYRQTAPLQWPSEGDFYIFSICRQYCEKHRDKFTLNYVENEIRKYLKCAILAYGFSRARVDDCRYDLIIAFSYKKRVCPSCCTQYLETTFMHIIDNILPKVLVRQFVFSLPRRIRYFTTRDSVLSRKVLKIFIDAIEQQYKKTW